VPDHTAVDLLVLLVLVHGTSCLRSSWRGSICDVQLFLPVWAAADSESMRRADVWLK
jgi:hypothetical protein